MLTDNSESYLDCPAPYRKITNWGECIYAGEMLRDLSQLAYSSQRQAIADGNGPHGCWFEYGQWSDGSTDWLIFNDEDSTDPSTAARSIICQSRFVEGTDRTCPEGFYQITDSSTCSEAATYLDVSHAQVRMNASPAGCYFTSHHSDSGDDDESCDDDGELGDSDDCHRHIICKKRYAVRLFGVGIHFSTAIEFNGAQHFLPNGTSWLTLGWLEPGESFNTEYHPILGQQRQTCHFLDSNGASTSTFSGVINSTVPAVVTVVFQCETEAPSFHPTGSPTTDPAQSPTGIPTIAPTQAPTGYPTLNPSSSPSMEPTQSPSVYPTLNPTGSPTVAPTQSPTSVPTMTPTLSPSTAPVDPSFHPTIQPSMNPVTQPTQYPTEMPSFAPTMNPTIDPTQSPTNMPSKPPSATPCYLRPADDCSPGNGLYCYYNNETDSCVDLPACPATGQKSCESYCGVEVSPCAVVSLNATDMCSCELCAGVTVCHELVTELLQFDADFNAFFPADTREESKAQFLSECATLLDPVNCTNVFAGSIYLQLEGERAAVDAAVSGITANGLDLPSFAPIRLLSGNRRHHITGDSDGFATIWIVLIIIAVCMCVLVGCFLNHRRKTHFNYHGGATPRAKPAVLEMDGKRFSDTEESSSGMFKIESGSLVSPIRKRQQFEYKDNTNISHSHTQEAANDDFSKKQEFKVYIARETKKEAPPLPPRPVSTVNVPIRNRGSSNV